MPGQQCTFSKPDGTRCRGVARRGREHCFAHDEASAEERRAARQKGGRERCKPREPVRRPPVPPPATLQEVAGFLGRLASEVYQGEITPAVCNAGVYACAALKGVLEAGDVLRRLDALERAQREKARERDREEVEPVGNGVAPPDGLLDESRGAGPPPVCPA
jgi:hypothetical protein